MEKTNEVNGIRWTVRTETGRDNAIKRQLHARVYNAELGSDDPEWGLWYDFCLVYLQSENVSGLPVPFPPLTLNVEALLPARDAWLALPGKVVRTWLADINEVEDVGDEDLLPPDQLPKADAATP